MTRALALTLALGCGATVPPDDDVETGDSGVVATDTSPDPCAPLTWETAGAPVVLTWCTPCHSEDLTGMARSGAPRGVDFDDEDDVRQRAARVWARALSDPPTMPPASGPSEDALDRLGAWLTCEGLTP